MVAENTMWISMCPSNLVGWIIKFYQIKRCCCWGDLHMMIINTFATTMTNKVKFRSKDPRGWTSERETTKSSYSEYWILQDMQADIFFKAQNMCWTIDIMTLCLNSKSMKKPFLFHTHFFREIHNECRHEYLWFWSFAYSVYMCRIFNFWSILIFAPKFESNFQRSKKNPKSRGKLFSVLKIDRLDFDTGHHSKNVLKSLLSIFTGVRALNKV